MARGRGSGGNSAFKQLRGRIKNFPLTLAVEVASKAAPDLTGLTQDAYGSGRNVYGDARPTSTVDGSPLTLDASGKTKTGLRFTSVGTVVRAVLPEKYQRFLIGKYGILPNGGLPAKWRSNLDGIVAKVKPPA
jgi:hypothetical protein